MSNFLSFNRDDIENHFDTKQSVVFGLKIVENFLASKSPHLVYGGDNFINHVLIKAWAMFRGGKGYDKKYYESETHRLHLSVNDWMIEKSLRFALLNVNYFTQNASKTSINFLAFDVVLWMTMRMEIPEEFLFYNELFESMTNGGKKLLNCHKTPDAVSLAKSMVKTYDFSAMPILADALEEAGLDDNILEVMRTQPEYWSEGSWAVNQLNLQG